MAIVNISPLFKYFGHTDPNKPLCNSGLKVLADRSLRVTPPNEFNDPFEFSPIVRPSETTDRKIKRILTDRSFFDQNRCKFPNCRNFTDFQKHMRANIGKVKQRLDNNSSKLADDFQDKFLPRVSQVAGVICFSSNATQPLMWAHYGSKHEGLMFEFAADCPLFQGKGFIRVDYPPDRVRPVYDPSKKGKERIQIEQIARRKSFDWKYEEEYRVIVELKHTYTPDGSTLHLLPIDPLWIVSVTFGLRCPAPLRTEAIRLLTEPELKHIRRFEIRMHRKTFDLKRHEL